MIPFEEAYDIVMSHAQVLDTEQTGLHEALHRILAEEIVSDIDMPPFDKAAMDGYACRRADLDRELAVVDTIKAGSPPSRAIGAGECAKIMTGAMLPEGANCVFMVEYVEDVREGVVRFAGAETRDNICYRGEDIRQGDVVLRPGARLGPEHIAVLATAGCAQPRVYRKARVGIIATGDELVPPSERPGPTQIRTSNSHQLYAQVLRADAIPRDYGIVRDTEPEIEAVLNRALEENDVVLISGGVSKGDFDFVPGIMQRNGIGILFEAIAIKPGKPTTFGVCGDQCCFGLPGNPVSTFMQFEILVKPYLYKRMGHDYIEHSPLLPLAKRIDAGRSKRAVCLPVIVNAEGRVLPAEYHGSAHIHALCQADGIIVVPANAGVMEEGSLVRVRWL